MKRKKAVMPKVVTAFFRVCAVGTCLIHYQRYDKLIPRYPPNPDKDR